MIEQAVQTCKPEIGLQIAKRYVDEGDVSLKQGKQLEAFAAYNLAEEKYKEIEKLFFEEKKYIESTDAQFRKWGVHIKKREVASAIEKEIEKTTIIKEARCLRAYLVGRSAADGNIVDRTRKLLDETKKIKWEYINCRGLEVYPDYLHMRAVLLVCGQIADEFVDLKNRHAGKVPGQSPRDFMKIASNTISAKMNAEYVKAISS